MSGEVAQQAQPGMAFAATGELHGIVTDCGERISA